MTFVLESPGKPPPCCMNIQHFEKGVRYDNDEFLLLARKVGKLATYCEAVKDESSWIRVEAERRPTQKKRDEIKVMVTVSLPRETLRAESRRPKVIDAVDRALEKMKPQISKYKDMHTGRQMARRG